MTTTPCPASGEAAASERFAFELAENVRAYRVLTLTLDPDDAARVRALIATDDSEGLRRFLPEGPPVPNQTPCPLADGCICGRCDPACPTRLADPCCGACTPPLARHADLSAQVLDGDDGGRYARIEIAPHHPTPERLVYAYVCPSTQALIVEIDGNFGPAASDGMPLRVYVNDQPVHDDREAVAAAAACWCDAGPMTGCWCDTWWVHVAREHHPGVAVGPFDDEREALRALDHGEVVAALRAQGATGAAVAHGEPDPALLVVHPDGSTHTEIPVAGRRCGLAPVVNQAASAAVPEPAPATQPADQLDGMSPLHPAPGGPR